MKLAGQATNYSTITQSFTLIDLVDEGSFFRWAVRCTETAAVGMWPCGSSVVFRRGVTVTFWIFGSPENLRPGCWDRKVGYNDQRFWCPSVLVAQHHLRQVAAGGFFLIAIFTVDCGVSCFVLDLDRPDIMTLIWCGESPSSWGTLSEERCHWQTVPRSAAAYVSWILAFRASPWGLWEYPPSWTVDNDLLLGWNLKVLGDFLHLPE